MDPLLALLATIGFVSGGLLFAGTFEAVCRVLAWLGWD